MQTIPTVSSSSKSEVLINDLVKKSRNTLHAEIKWILKVVRSHFSYRSCQGLNALFIDMFGESPVANDFKLSRTKCSYFVRHGLLPYFRDSLAKDVKSSPFFSISFDESLNKALQKNQMDIQIRYWCPSSNIVKVRYWGFTFQYKTSAEVLTAALLEILKDLDMSKMIQLSMDGPTVNWLILKLLQKERD